MLHTLRFSLQNAAYFIMPLAEPQGSQRSLQPAGELHYTI